MIMMSLRAISDYEYEMQIAQMNRTLNEDVETVFLMTNTKYSFISSSIVKEVTRFGGEVDGIIPVSVQQKLKEKFRG